MKSKTLLVGCLVLLSPIIIFAAEPAAENAAETAAANAAVNARQIGLALFEFETEFSQYPSSDSKGDVEALTNRKLPEDRKFSNDLFSQLFFGGYLVTEQSFHAVVPGCVVPDNVTTVGELLKKGENAFSYITGLKGTGNPGIPHLMTPLIPGTTTFDPKPFNGKAVVLHTDCTVQVYEIQKDGHIYRDGINLLSSKHPIWKGKAPDIRYPE